MDVPATGEVVRNADLNQEGGEAVGKVGVKARAADAKSTLKTSCEPFLILRITANADAGGDLNICTTTKREQVVTQRFIALIEGRDGVKGATPRSELDKGIVTTVGAVVTRTVFKSPLFGRGVLLDRNRVEVQLGSQCGVKSKVPKRP